MAQIYQILSSLPLSLLWHLHDVRGFRMHHKTKQSIKVVKEDITIKKVKVRSKFFNHQHFSSSPFLLQFWYLVLTDVLVSKYTSPGFHIFKQSKLQRSTLLLNNYIFLVYSAPHAPQATVPRLSYFYPIEDRIGSVFPDIAPICVYYWGKL